MTMEDRNHRDHTNPSARRRSWIAIGTLLAVTLVLGAATRGGLIASGGGPASIEAPARGHSVAFAGNLDRTAVLLGSDGLVRMELVMSAEDRPDSAVVRQPTDLVVILDRSGSMQGQKIADARMAVRQLISQLGPQDRFSLVAFSSAAELAIPLAYASSAAVARWEDAVAAISAGGGTFMGPALDLAFGTIETARSSGRTPRAILISDGLASEAHSALHAKASRAARGEYALSTVGVGSDFDEELMALLSDAGTGNYYYLADTRELAEVFSNEFATARETLATGLEVRIDPGPGVAVVEASGYPLESSGGSVRFRPGSLFAGQQRHVWVSFRVPTDRATPSSLGAVELSYTDRGEVERIALGELPPIARVEEQKDFFARLDVDRWAQSVAVEEYNDLYERVASHVKAGRKDEAERAVREFRSRNEALNRVAASPLVAARLDDSRDLDDSIAGAFEGADQQQKQKLLGKALHGSSYKNRRVGSRK